MRLITVLLYHILAWHVEKKRYTYYNRKVMQKQTGVYQEKVTTLLKENPTLFSLGLFTVFFIVSGILIATNQKRMPIAQIDQDNREAFMTETPANNMYTVQEGEGLWQIAEKTTGNGENWTKIAAANGITNPDSIVAGQKLRIDGMIGASPVPGTPPEGAHATPTGGMSNEVTQNGDGQMNGVQNPTPIEQQGQIDTGLMTQKANPSVKEYIVLEGEGLWQIAQKIYGDGNVWTEIMKANNITDPNGVYPGMKLVMPAIK